MARLDDEDRRDAAGVGPYARGQQGLRPLSDLDGWDITDGSADIRGWQVVTLGGRELGRVEDLLVDTEEHEVVMFTIDLKDSDRVANAPLRAAQIERDQHLVRIDSADLQGIVPTDVVHDRDRGLAAGAATAGAVGAAEAARERKVERDAERKEADRELADRDYLERERVAREARPDRDESLLDRIKVHHREKEVEKHAERDADRAAADAPVERVVERRPVVVEEVVVRRRTVDPESGETLKQDEQRAADREAELRRDKPGETF